MFGELFGNAYSASMTVGAEFPTSNVHVEIDAIAVLPPPDGRCADLGGGAYRGGYRMPASLIALRTTSTDLSSSSPRTSIS